MVMSKARACVIETDDRTALERLQSSNGERTDGEGGGVCAKEVDEDSSKRDFPPKTPVRYKDVLCLSVNLKSKNETVY